MMSRSSALQRIRGAGSFARALCGSLAPVEGPGAKPAVTQIVEKINYAIRGVATPTEYRMYRLYERGRGHREALGYLSGLRFREVYGLLNSAGNERTLADKDAFHDRYGHLRFPLPRRLATWRADPQQVRKQTDVASVGDLAKRLAIWRGRRVIVKPLGTYGGSGIVILEVVGSQGDPVLRGPSNVMTIEEFVTAHLRTAGDCVFEEVVDQDASLRELVGDNTSIVRVGSFLRADNSVQIPYAIFYAGTCSNEVVNLHIGALAVRVQQVEGVGAGKLAAVGYTAPERGFDRLDAHPETGVRFEGYELPHWEDTVALVRQLAHASAPLRVIGWDILLSPRGPVVLEGNHDSGPQMPQLDTPGFLSPDYRAQLRAITGVELPVSELPPVRFRPAFRTAMRWLHDSPDVAERTKW